MGNCIGDSKRHPFNNANGSVVRKSKRYTLVRRVATATTQITIRAIPRHGKLKISDYSLLAQFGLTPKSTRGLNHHRRTAVVCRFRCHLLSYRSVV